MALTKQQEIDIAKQRIAQGTGSSLDKSNVSAYDRSLSGTMTGTKPRTLPQETDQLANFSSVMRQLQNANLKTQPSPVDKLKDFQATTGLEARSTGAITGGIEMGERERLEQVVERSRTAIDLVSEQEKRKETQRQENKAWALALFNSVEDPMSVFSGEDIENMKLGLVTPEMTARVKAAKAAKADFQFVPGDENTPTGVFDKSTGKFTQFTDIDAGIVGGFNISKYATDPNHERSVNSLLQGMGQFKTPEDITAYIQRKAPGSPITAEIIQNTSSKYGVPWEMLVAMMEQDSSLGTKGLGARNNNPGNMGQFDSLGTKGVKGYATLQEGVDVVGAWLSRNRATPTKAQSSKPLAVLDVARYNEIYPTAGIVAGDSLDIANQKAASAQQKIDAEASAPIDQSEDDLFTNAQNAKDSGISYEDVLKEIDADVSLKNKDQAKEIAKSVYDIEGQAKLKTIDSFWQYFFGPNRGKDQGGDIMA